MYAELLNQFSRSQVPLGNEERTRNEKQNARLLTVVYTLREDSVRLISARKSTKKEAKHYAKRV
jgi:uncharacterized DUF497 family protein